MGVKKPLSETFYVCSKLISSSKRYQKAALSVSQQNPKTEKHNLWVKRLQNSLQDILA